MIFMKFHQIENKELDLKIMNIVFRVNSSECQFHRKITEFTLFMNFISQMKNSRNSPY